MTDLWAGQNVVDRKRARSPWCGLAVAGFLGLLATPLVAQNPYRSSYFPYVIGNPSDGVMLVARWQRTQNAPYFISQSDVEDVINPVTFSGAFSVEAGIGTSGSGFGRVEFRGPAIVDGWRFRGYLAAERHAKLGYYGLGGDIEQAGLAPDPNADEFRVRRDRFQVVGEVTRRIAGPLRFGLGVTVNRTEFASRDTASLFEADYGRSLARTDIGIRPVLVLDTRDREFTPGRGVLLEAGVTWGAGGTDTTTGARQGYAGAYTHLRGFVSPRDGTVFAGRFLYRTVDEAAPLQARLSAFGWEREMSTAGADGHRSFPLGALASADFALASAEIRHDLLNAGDFGAVTLVGFADWARASDPAARVREATTQFGAGGGVAVRVLRSAVLSANFAGGPNGFNFSMGTGWAF
ncbi:MAG: BamA/TamA family outer membrane protein [Gemmatimonadales bacterium]